MLESRWLRDSGYLLRPWFPQGDGDATEQKDKNGAWALGLERPGPQKRKNKVMDACQWASPLACIHCPLMFDKIVPKMPVPWGS